MIALLFVLRNIYLLSPLLVYPLISLLPLLFFLLMLLLSFSLFLHFSLPASPILLLPSLLLLPLLNLQVGVTQLSFPSLLGRSSALLPGGGEGGKWEGDWRE